MKRDRMAGSVVTVSESVQKQWNDMHEIIAVLYSIIFFTSNSFIYVQFNIFVTFDIFSD